GREFFGLTFRVTPATLIPRPDTELLVELALQRIPESSAATGGVACRVLDMGAGSGAIALAIALARPAAEVVAVDASTAALQVARENMQRLGVNNAQLLQSDWFAALTDARFDLIVSNPPYIAEQDEHLSQGDVRFEPITALASGADGLDDIRRIISGAPAHLKPGGWLMLEHGYDQAEKVRQLLLQGGFSAVDSMRDLAGIARVTFGRI
ncbi:MAG: peptide chain release factor N(5)-glutamine methyltransferase, partial [Gallionella sp.]|nr:peptide chain release factor N(5)-glutamine methyltransferase [Gallionella sp.]